MIIHIILIKMIHNFILLINLLIMMNLNYGKLIIKTNILNMINRLNLLKNRFKKILMILHFIYVNINIKLYYIL